MRTSLWVVIVLVAVWMGFLFGFAVASHGGTKGAGAAAPGTEAPAASSGGYGR